MENKTSKYLKYAIGEIVLVVIGILIALQINNWNEEQKLKKEEQFLLKELNKELTTNLIKIRRDYERNTESAKATNALLELFKKPNKETLSPQIDSLFTVLFSGTSFDATTGVVDEVISTGKLKILKNDSLRYMLSQWSGVISDLDEDIDIRARHFENFLVPEVATVYNVKNTNSYVDFSFWSDDYKRTKISLSAFPFKPEELFTKKMEGFLYIHSVNLDWVLLNDLNGEKYILQMLELIKKDQH